MSKKQKEAIIPSHMSFTLMETKMLKDALLTFERGLQRQDKRLPNIDFAREVVCALKEKLNRLLHKEDWSEEVPFDFNEVFLLCTALHLYLLELRISKSYDLIPQCVQLWTRFLAMSDFAYSMTGEHVHHGSSSRLA